MGRIKRPLRLAELVDLSVLSRALMWASSALILTFHPQIQYVQNSIVPLQNKNYPFSPTLFLTSSKENFLGGSIRSEEQFVVQPYVKKQPTEPKNSFQPSPVSVHVFDHTLETRLHLDNVQDDLVEDEDNAPLGWKRKGRRGVNEQEPTPTEIIAHPSLASKDSQQQHGLRSGFLRKSLCQTKEKGK
ncbi:hypothetical protein H5410_045168 [Solanum commersonii]|uniref:Uncharacterized protein n=1 Tax=Solanum commersonii TaxID=4109 RepID=A0A9J5XBW3_SOLCO|nr:hypothetical protein H5410_045168 [Solanum commersonii]